MKTTMMIPAGLCLLLSGLGVARADVGMHFSAGLMVEPTAPMPAMLPPAPPAALPPAPVYMATTPHVAMAPATTGGQWVFTAQYGWVYMPYGSRYVVATASPYAFVFAPSYGWRWLSAPWVIGSGPYPHFGNHGPFAYAWYRGLGARHPMAVHYSQVKARPVGPRATAPVYHAPGVRRAAPAPRPTVAAPARTAARPAAVAWQPRAPRHTVVGRR